MIFLQELLEQCRTSFIIILPIEVILTLQAVSLSRIGGVVKNFFHKLKEDYAALRKLEASPREVAIGAAVGLVLDFIPSFGCGIMISAVLSSWLGGNMTASVISNVAFGPLIPLLYGLNIIVGRFSLGRLSPRFTHRILHYSLERVSPTWLLPVMQHRFLRWLKVFGPEFALGCLVNSVLFFVLTKFLLERLLVAHRENIRH